jgi:hypothetical protein
MLAAELQISKFGYLQNYKYENWVNYKTAG